MSDIEREIAAVNALAKFLADAKEVARLHGLAGMSVPGPVLRVLGPTLSATTRPRGDGIRRSDDPPIDRPDDWREDWLWVYPKDLNPSSLIRAILREKGAPVTVKAMIACVREHQPEAIVGSIYNVGPRLEAQQVITRSPEGWQLNDGAPAPVLYRGRAWGPASVFEKADLAAHRRSMIVDLLRSESDGLMIMQIMRKLRSMECRAPVNKELIQYDIEVMTGKVVRRRGNTRKWVLVEEGK